MAKNCIKAFRQPALLQWQHQQNSSEDYKKDDGKTALTPICLMPTALLLAGDTRGQSRAGVKGAGQAGAAYQGCKVLSSAFAEASC